MAWGNYDVQIETLDRKNTLHITVGIAFPNYITELHQRQDSVDATNVSWESRRKYENEVKEISLFSMNLKFAKFKFQDNPMQTELNISSQPLDFVWTIKTVDCKTPMFNEFYFMLITDPLPQSIIAYMNPISQSAKRNDVVHETLERSLKVANKPGQK